MVRRKITGAVDALAPRTDHKCERAVDPYDVPDDNAAIKKRRRTANVDLNAPSPIINDDEVENDENVPQPELKPTPSKRRGRPPKAAPTVTNGQATTPSAQRQRTVQAVTPIKSNGVDTPSRRSIADRSARKKSARALIERVMGDAVSDDELEDRDIAREIYESSEEEQEEEDDEEQEQEEEQEPATPSNRGRPGRKPRARARKRSPTPPRDLPPHEQYFYQNKPGLTKTSSNTLSSLKLLTHEEYFSLLPKLKDSHAADVDFLHSLHAESFPQWAFEMSQGFTLCLYGYGSKRRLLHNFACYLNSNYPSPNHRIVIINGYVRNLTARDILTTLLSALSPNSDSTSDLTPTISALLSQLSSTPLTLTLLINSVDSPSLRKSALQFLFCTLACHHSHKIRLALAADTPDFFFLWDASARAQLNLAFHDATTFAPRAPCEIDVVDEVHELLGRKTRRVGGKEGVIFVLRSLPENARSLFRLLVGEVLVAMEDESKNGEEAAVEYRMVYQKAVEEFICSSEMAFRTLLKEYVTHFVAALFSIRLADIGQIS